MTKQIKITSNAIADVYLQTISENDASDEYVQWLNDPLVNQYLETRFYQQDLASVIGFIKGILENPNEHLFTIRLKSNDKHIGNIKIGPINPHHNIGDVSLFIGDKDSWGKGIATQAIALISQYSFEQLKLRKLCAGAYKANVGSTKAFLKAGYVSDGVLANHYTFNGKPCDLVQVCLFNNQADKIVQIDVIPIAIS
ncbi:GNAT family N-acetyltransferase [Litorilituus sediminis]|uniref:N-acetyltransferase n=1 Tax=Litorilituus sediminis TaxID=718192 RepID=A0A4P6P6Y9_9GAMM|nr:GNAT family protein [Litorilituus sediminis]QBG35222.1 N-acetyltransferase [Litorilituus sediminis]